jgi:uncharacterized glyoxalase superfamily protein PhnB
MSLHLTTVELKTFVPAQNFQLSKRFYQALGFTMASEEDGVAFFHHGGSSFLLQDFFVAEHAVHVEMHLLVENVDDWWEHVRIQQITTQFGVQVGALVDQLWGMRDFTLFDPSGVLWRIAQNTPRR